MIRRLCLITAFCVIGPAVSGSDPDSITEKEFEKLHAEIDTPKDSPWRSIPWKISLLEAQNEAAKTNKPIFIWAMDGHPLGCT